MRTEHPIGTVTSNQDPAKSGRVKVELAQLDGQEYPEWIEPIWPAGEWIAIPEPGDSVEVVLPEGDDKIEFSGEVRYRGKVIDPSNPVPAEFKINYPGRRGFKTRVGHLLILDDTAGSEEVTLIHKDGHLVSLTNAGIYFGSQTAAEPLVLGNLWKSLESSFMQAFLTHFHATGVGPSGTPDPTSAATVTALKSGVDASNQLSDFIWGQKVK